MLQDFRDNDASIFHCCECRTSCFLTRLYLYLNIFFRQSQHVRCRHYYAHPSKQQRPDMVCCFWHSRLKYVRTRVSHCLLINYSCGFPGIPYICPRHSLYSSEAQSRNKPFRHCFPVCSNYNRRNCNAYSINYHL